MAKLFLGVDAGSSVTKVAVFDENGQQLGMGWDFVASVCNDRIPVGRN
jgi:N-acetylglucosamine kinase-like BadF-type ATPase